MKIQFERLGPLETVTYNGCQYKNGDIAEMEEAHAKAYLAVKLAAEVVDPVKAMERIKLEEKNAAVREKARKDPKMLRKLDDELEQLAGASEMGGKR